MNKRTDDGRTKFNTDVQQFPETGQKSTEEHNVPPNDDNSPHPQVSQHERQEQDRQEQDKPDKS